MTDELAEEFKLKSKNGALIGGVSKKGPADRAGIQAGDVITEINGKTVTDPDSLRLMITQIKPGSDVKVKIIRKGALQELTAKLDTLPGEEELAKNSSETGDDVKPLEVPFGLVLGSLKDEQRREQGAPRSLEGVVIKDIKGGSIAEDVGLEPGDIIQSINQQPVSDVKDAQALLKKSKGKKAVLLVWRKGMSQFVVLND
jgi:serine protease Do